MSETLIRNAHSVLTMDDAGSEFAGADVLIRDGEIVQIGEGLTTAGEVVEAANCVVTPGLVNTHHHLYQTLTRAVPGGQDALLFGWLQTLYPIWSRFGPEEMRISALTGLAELALSGCTLTSDHLYLYPNGARLDDTIDAATEIGLRFHATRGAMSIGESDGGLPPDALVEREEAILEDCIRVIDAFHDPSEGAMVRGAVLAVFGEPRADARRGTSGPGQGRDDAHAPCRERRGHRLFRGAVRLPARSIRRGTGLDRPRCLARTLREARRSGD